MTIFETIGVSSGYIGIILLLAPIGNYVCKWVLMFSGIVSSTAEPSSKKEDKIRAKAGWYIGILERGLICIGIVFGSWEVLVAVIALKTVARYKELDEQINAEYFLIGSLASMLWAIIITIVLSYYDQKIGASFIADTRAIMSRNIINN